MICSWHVWLLVHYLLTNFSWAVYDMFMTWLAFKTCCSCFVQDLVINSRVIIVIGGWWRKDGSLHDLNGMLMDLSMDLCQAVWLFCTWDDWFGNLRRMLIGIHRHVFVHEFGSDCDGLRFECKRLMRQLIWKFEKDARIAWKISDLQINLIWVCLHGSSPLHFLMCVLALL